ncbi:diaphanous GTPase-binding domain-containing protein [Hirsutella rhossiliensis]|uniref:Diaphanous GTPase-binding domain-containing protein n=1 Tax=Hirsutella rhossiliensis TaxID=111463 RepID=A0A9P8SDL5_9HYPO|nr:diaphanous GTPase-binding domain-containing protein [Hirsutella rhossiliensis]KAH0958726.1 diaphanous GTPase-binding domain-containing protein [Hirsutella rhossiliensis]
MASDGHVYAPDSPALHQDHKPSSGLISFLHRRRASSGRFLPSSPLPSLQDGAMAVGHFAKNNPGALGELQHNRQESAPRSPPKSLRHSREAATTTYTWGNVSLKPVADRNSPTTSPSKPKKKKSGTNLVGLLSRPKSLKNLYKLSTDDELRASRDKENRQPDEPVSAPAAPPPIFAQYTCDPEARRQRERCSVDSANPPPAKDRPKSLHAARVYSDPKAAAGSRKASSTEKPMGRMQRGRVFDAFSALTHAGRSKSAASSPTVEYPEHILRPHDIEQQLEDLLDRRNIPENQRYKMRNLNDTIKMEFIRQDWAEMQAARMDRSVTAESSRSPEHVASTTPAGSDCDDDKPKRTRGRSFTFSRGKKESRSPSKKPKGEGSVGRHLRSKSIDSVAPERPSSSGHSTGSTLLSKIKLQQGPGDYVAYLRKVQKPELVEVGKLHKLRLLLRNETVTWIEDFIQQGGMKEIVGLLNRIMEVEWREEHEDALLHENLLCLKALSTTARAMEYLHSVQADLFRRLLHLLFDPDKKGPSEFTTRNIITSVLLTYIESAAPADRVARAKIVLAHLRDQEPKEEERPLPFVLEMRQQRPYRVWCKEVVSVTKEVFWIFLHNLNVVALPSDKDAKTAAAGATSDDVASQAPYAYMLRHFPPERPPVPAAPYVGGVEWDATNYLASHLDVMNAILACTPTPDERNALRSEFRISGWERCLGGSLRLCKEKFYGSVHTALRTWVAAAAEDGWDVRDVRFGPSPETRKSPCKAGGGGDAKVKMDEAPKLDMPKLDFEPGRPRVADDAWL